MAVPHLTNCGPQPTLPTNTSPYQRITTPHNHSHPHIHTLTSTSPCAVQGSALVLQSAVLCVCVCVCVWEGGVLWCIGGWGWLGTAWGVW